MTSDYLRDARILVIGSGVIGATQAYRLSQAGARVTVVERGHPGGGTTGSTFAWVNGFNKPPRHYERMNVLGARDHEDLASELDGDWLHIRGTLIWADRDDPARIDHVRTSTRRSTEWGTRIDIVDPTALRDMEPDLVVDPEAVGQIHLVHRTGWLEPVALTHAALQAAVRRHGAVVEPAEVTGFEIRHDSIVGTRLHDGRVLEADVVMNCAGPGAAGLAALAGVSLPVEQLPGVIVTSTPVPVRLRHVIRTPAGNARPDGGGRLAFGFEWLDTLVTRDGGLQPESVPVRAAFDGMRRLIPGLAAGRPEAVRIGVRAVPKDAVSIVGFDPRIGNLYHVVTHSGITLAARLAMLVAEELTGGGDEALAPYRPQRFLAA